jgi:KaiC/GvpD/RAD55 family RecA-like ATPase
MAIWSDTPEGPPVPGEITLLPTHVEGLDRALGGGIPTGSTVLVAGPPGTLKTSLVLWMMHANAGDGTKGLYVTLEQTAESLLTQAARLGLPPIPESQLYVVDLPTLRRGRPETEREKDWISIVKLLVEEGVRGSGYGTVAIDSLQALYALAPMESPRREMFHLVAALKELGVTLFLIGETPFGARTLAHWGEDFLADGILYLHPAEVGDADIQLRLRCVKMRWMNHARETFALNFDGGRFFLSKVLAKRKEASPWPAVR